MSLNVTHTFAVMELSDGAYQEIKAKMQAAGYSHAFDEAGNIDMHGIAVNRTVASLNVDPRLPEGMHCSTCQCPKLHAQVVVPGNKLSRSWHDNAMTERPK